MSQQCVTTFTRQTFSKQANLRTHTTFIIAEIQTYTLLQLWRKVLELLFKLYHGLKKNANNIIDTFTKATKSSQVLVMLFL